MIHYPRGQMCLSCVKLNDDCSNLLFEKMHELETDSNGDIEVVCNQRSKSNESTTIQDDK